MSSEGGSGKTEPIRINVKRYSDDEICMRISIGGFQQQKLGIYCRYRFGPEGGTIKDVVRMVETVLLFLKRTPELPISDDDANAYR